MFGGTVGGRQLRLVGVGEVHLRTNGPFFECFPYVCPDPVAVQRSFLYTNGSKRPFLFTSPCEATLPGSERSSSSLQKETHIQFAFQFAFVFVQRLS